MTAERDATTSTAGRVFQWHPEYQGRRFEDVQRDLADEIARDQRQYEVALMGAEDSEHDALASVVDIERRWSAYDFGWHEADADDFARRVVEFQWAREQRQDLFSWQEYRRTSGTTSRAAAKGTDWRASMSDDRRRTVANGLAALILGLIVVAIAIVVILML